MKNKLLKVLPLAVLAASLTSCSLSDLLGWISNAETIYFTLCVPETFERTEVEAADRNNNQILMDEVSAKLEEKTFTSAGVTARYRKYDAESTSIIEHYWGTFDEETKDYSFEADEVHIRQGQQNHFILNCYFFNTFRLSSAINYFYCSTNPTAEFQEWNDAGAEYYSHYTYHYSNWDVDGYDYMFAWNADGSLNNVFVDYHLDNRAQVTHQFQIVATYFD